MTDALLQRLTFEPEGVEAPKINWPKGLAPNPATHYDAPGALSQADVLVVTWTSAEWMALADVLTPGIHKTQWVPYKHNWAEFEPHLTGRSPAKDAQCLGQSWMTRIGLGRAALNVLVFHSELHLSTDDDTAPVIALWKQLITEVRPKLVITTGTAGGIGTHTQLGDVFIVCNAKFNCTETFKSQPWAQTRYAGPPFKAMPRTRPETLGLIHANGDRLKPIATRLPVLTRGGDVETVDYFAFADSDDSYGVVKNDRIAHTEEMDDATLPLALSQLDISDGDWRPNWLSIRNASDPQVPSSIGDLEAQKKWAENIYEKYGYWTTVGSAVACWGVIAGMA